MIGKWLVPLWVWIGLAGLDGFWAGILERRSKVGAQVFDKRRVG